MKPVDFDYVRPTSLKDAISILAAEPDAKAIAGGQTLGPMLNLRLARPSVLVDISRLGELQQVAVEGDSVLIGSGVTHAAIEDRRFDDTAGGMLAAVAHGIAYRAVRNRGTIGGSIAHADPAADWLAALVALDAQVSIAGPAGRRDTAIAVFVAGAMTTTLGAGELVTGARVPGLSKRARWGFHKICRKTGEFAHAIGAVVVDPERGMKRAVAGATGGPPIVIPAWEASWAIESWQRALLQAGYVADPYELQIHAVALARAAKETARP